LFGRTRLRELESMARVPVGLLARIAEAQREAISLHIQHQL